MSVEPLTFGPFRLNPENMTLSRDGVLVPIGQKGALILAALSMRVGEVLTKTQLVDAAWQGMAVEESNLSVQIAALRKALGKTPGGGEWIVTVPRVGYRLFAEPAAQPSTLEMAGAPRLSIVVLPFANLGGDAQHEHFVDGVTESLTTDLSRIRDLIVVGRHTAFTYKSKIVDLRQIARELNVRYILEGSVQRGGNRMRVNVQLVNAESGVHLWAERFDNPLADLFDMQDEIVSRLANALHAQLIAAEARRAEHAPKPDSMELYFRALAAANTPPGRLSHAERLFEQALSLDPHNIEAMVGLASVNQRLAAGYRTDDRSGRLGRAEAALQRVLVTVPNHAAAHMFMGAVRIYSNRALQGIFDCERALALDRNLAASHGFIGVAKLMMGRPEETEAHVREQMRLSPGDNRVFNFTHIVGAANLHLGRDEEAIPWFRQALEYHPRNSITHFYLAAALAFLGRTEEARVHVQTGLVGSPTFTIALFRAGASSDNSAYLTQRERDCEGMRKAGVPEQ